MAGEDSESKRALMGEEEPSKRQKTGAEADKVQVLRSALKGADLGLPWFSSLRDLLLAMAPAALDPSQSHQALVARLTSGVLIAEEKRIEERVATAQADVQQVKAQRHECRLASERAAEILQQKDVDVTGNRLKTLGDDCVGLSDAEANFKQCTQKMLAKEIDICSSAMKNHLEPVNSGTEHQRRHHVSMLLRICKKLGNDGDQIEALRCAMEAKPAERTDEQHTALGGFEQTLKDHLRTAEKLRTFNKKICFQPPGEAGAMSRDDASAVVEHHAKKELAKARANCLEAKRDNWEPLKTGKQGAKWFPGEQAHHLSVIGMLVKRAEPSNECLHTALAVALKKGPSERGDFDDVVVQEVENVLNKHISEIALQVGNLLAEEEACQEFLDCTSNVKEMVKLEVGMNNKRRKVLSKDKEKCLLAQADKLQALKNGSCEQSKALQKDLDVLTKILKNLDNSSGNPHTFDESLLEALTAAVQRNPENRSDFDKTVIEQIACTFEKRIKFTEEQLDTIADGGLEELVSAADEAELAFLRASDRQLASAKAVIDAEEDAKRAKNSHEAAEKSFLDSETRVAQAEATQATHQDTLQMIRKAIATLGSEDAD